MPDDRTTELARIQRERMLWRQLALLRTLARLSMGMWAMVIVAWTRRHTGHVIFASMGLLVAVLIAIVLGEAITNELARLTRPR